MWKGDTKIVAWVSFEVKFGQVTGEIRRNGLEPLEY
jgi:hypothetical protein